MKKIFKIIWILTFPVILIYLIVFSYNVLKLDYQYGFQSANVYQFTYPWQKYLIFNELKKFSNKIFEKKNYTNFPKIKIYISEKSSKKLISNLPDSSKYWVDASINLGEEKNYSQLQKIKLRYRGDNPEKWLKEKKSFRIKTKKNEMINGYRNFDYYRFRAETYIPFKILTYMNLLSQKFRLVEVFFNDETRGLFYEMERIDESFLRKNKIMPVNIYKGENLSLEKKLGINDNLFNNPGLWTKVAVFNQNNEKNYDDLNLFLKKLKSNKFLHDPTLDGFIDITNFAKLNAFFTITGNIHHDYYHNMRLISDPWNGNISQIIVDPEIRTIEKFALDFTANDLGTFLNKNTKFIHEKYKWLYFYLTKEDVLKQVNKYFSDIKNELEVIKKKEPYEHFSTNHVSLINEKLLVLKKNKEIILDQLNSNPKSFWNKNNNGFDIIVDDVIPVYNLNLTYNEADKPEWIGVDLNYDNQISDEEPKYYFNNKSKTINIPIILYANRFKKNNNPNFLDTSDIDHAATYFQFITSRNTLPEKIEATNFFNNNIFTLLNKNNNSAVKKNISNNIILLNNLEKKKETILSGDIVIDQDIVFDQKIIIQPNTNFLIKPNKNIIFKKQVLMLGTNDQPIIFKKFDENLAPWGSVALIGQNTEGSVINGTLFSGGSGGNYNQFKFTSMFSLHKTKNIKIQNSKFELNEIFDDTIHIIYCENIHLDNIKILNANADAIDIDVSKKIFINNINIFSPKNDGIDLMESEVEINNLWVKNSKDKGISVGENSKTLIKNATLINNNIGIAVKDKSEANIYDSNLIDNKVQVAAYAKNWHYGGGGIANFFNSKIESKKNYFVTLKDPEELLKKTKDQLVQNSLIKISTSEIIGPKELLGSNIYSD